MPVYAELRDGSVVELAQDCGCQTHDGPHWLHMDKLDKEQNRGLLQQAKRGGVLQVAILREHAAAELRRLDEKARKFHANKISRILPRLSEVDRARMHSCDGVGA